MSSSIWNVFEYAPRERERQSDSPHYTTLQLIKNSSEWLRWFSHIFRSSGKPISSHGFLGPLKCRTAAESTTSGSGTRRPNSDKCHKGSIACTLPSKATKAGGSQPKRQRAKSDSRFCMRKRHGDGDWDLHPSSKRHQESATLSVVEWNLPV